MRMNKKLSYEVPETILEPYAIEYFICVTSPEGGEIEGVGYEDIVG